MRPNPIDLPRLGRGPAAVVCLALGLLALPASTTPAPEQAPALDELEIAVLLAPFAPAAESTESEGDAGSKDDLYPVALWVQVDGQSLLGSSAGRSLDPAGSRDPAGSPDQAGSLDQARSQRQPGEELTVGLRARALDSAGIPRARIERQLELDLATEGERLSSSSLRIYDVLPLPPGSYELDLSVVVVGSGRSAERRFSFEVPRREPQQAALLPPFFVDDEGTALVRRRADPELVYPFLEGDDLEFVPDIAPVMTPDMPRARLVLLGYHLLRADVLLDAALVTADGRRLGKDRLLHVGGTETAKNGLDRLYFSLETEGLRAGRYRFEVTLHDLSHGRSRHTFLPLRIAASEE